MKSTAFNKVNRSTTSITFTALLLITALFCSPNIWAETLNLGAIGPSASKNSKFYAPLLEYLATKGIDGKVITVPTIEDMVEKFKEGSVDYIFDSPYAVVVLMDKVKAKPVLIREKKGVKEYNAVIFVKADFFIKEISDLKGQVIAFESPDSTSSYMLPKKVIENAGLTLVESPEAVAGKVAYYFTKEDDNTVYHVKAGRKAQAGGIKKSAVDGNADFRLLQPESPFVPRHVVALRDGVDGTKLISTLLDMKNDAGAKDLLKELKTPTGFSKFDGDPIELMSGPVRKALGL